MKGWKNVGVNLPNSVVAIITAAGGADPAQGGMPRALASILGALPWIAVELHKALPADEDAAFAAAARDCMKQAWDVIGSDDPPAAFDVLFKAAEAQQRKVN